MVGRSKLNGRSCHLNFSHPALVGGVGGVVVLLPGLLWL